MKTLLSQNPFLLHFYAVYYLQLKEMLMKVKICPFIQIIHFFISWVLKF